MSSEVTLAVIGNEKGADGPARIVCAKVASAPVEATELPIRTPRFEDGPANRQVSQLLRQPQILGDADVSEFSAMLGIMLFQLGMAAESGSAGEEQEGEE